MKFAIVSVFFLMFGGCQPILKMVYGAKKPVVQTPENITQWLKTEGIPAMQVASVGPRSFADVFINYADGLKIFSAEGKHLVYGYTTGKFCSKDLDEILAGLAPVPFPPSLVNAYVTTGDEAAPSIPYERQLNIQELFAALRTLKGEAIQLNAGGADYVVLVPFALAYGRRLQTKDIRFYLKAISKNRFSRFSVWYINFDKQAW